MQAAPAAAVGTLGRRPEDAACLTAAKRRATNEACGAAAGRERVRSESPSTMRNRAIMLATIVGAGAVLALWAVTRFVWLENVVRLEAHAVEASAAGAASALHRETAKLSMQARAASSAEFAVAPQCRPAAAGAAAGELPARYDADIVAVADAAGRLSCLHQRGSPTEMSPQTRADMTRHLAPTGPLVRGGLRRLGVRGLVTAGGVPYAVASSPIRSAGSGGAVVGVLVLARRVTADRLADPAQRPLSALTVMTPASILEHSGGGPLLRALRRQGACVRALGKERIQGYALLGDLQGQPAVVLRVDRPRTMYNEGLAGTRYFVLSLVLVIAAFGLAALWILERVVVDRVERLMADVQSIENSVDPSARVRVDGGDELASLGMAVNRMLETLQRAQVRLVASETRFRDIAVNASDWVWELDAAGRHTYVSERIHEVLGHYPAECIGRPLSWLAVPDSVAFLEQTVRTTMRQHESMRNLQVWAATKDNRRVYVQLSGVPVFAADGSLSGYRGVGKDVTEQVRVEETQRLAAVGQLAAGVAHEFNNILASLRMSAELCGLSDDIEDYREANALMLRGSLRGADICSSLLRFGRPEEPKRESISIEAPIEAALTMAVREVENAGVVVVRNYASRGQSVYADRNQLEQVFLNLIINACHAMSEGGQLRFDTQFSPDENGGMVWVQVSDTGCGIAPEDLGRVFEPFFTTKGRLGEGDTHGTGLGLSVSHGIITAHGGRIAVESGLDGGTRFTIGLQACRAECDLQPPECETARTTWVRQGRRVLVVDDEDDLRRCLANALRTVGHHVRCAESGGQAADLMAADEFDLVLTDVMMPGGGARVVLEAAARCLRPPRVLVMTGRIDERVARDFGEMGATGFLWKPFTLDELLRKSAEALQEATVVAMAAQST